MGKYVFDNFQCARDVFEEASSSAGQNIAELCFSEDEADGLRELANAKMAIFTLSIASSTVLMQEFGITPDYCAGHSAGEYSALCCAGVLNLGDAVTLLQERSKIINSLLSEVSGTMAWVVKLDGSEVEGVVASLQDEGHQIYISGYDCPGQTSISVTTDSFRHCAAALEAAGAIVIPIKTTGPFHSPLMAKASARFGEILAHYEFGRPRVTVLANHSARPYTEDRDQTLENLTLHLVKPVQWHATTRFFLTNQVRYAIELGPNEIVRFMLEKNTKAISCRSLDREKHWEAFRSEWLVDDDDIVRAIGACLGAIASTRNECRDLECFERDVIKPNNDLKTLLDDLRTGRTQVSKSHLEHAIEITGSVLAAKQVPEQKMVARLGKILGPHVISLRQEAQ
jgi:[acyl-carrier-protein] S-malonyltransferase